MADTASTPPVDRSVQVLSSSSLPPDSPKTFHTGRLLFYFGLMYFCEGICQMGALMNQPIRTYLKEQGYPADRTSWFFFVLGIPWMLKPVYGLISDFIPFLGYRRRTYLILLNLTAAMGFCWMLGFTTIPLLLTAAVMVGVGVAAADVIVDALMIEVGQRTGLIARFQSVQWICVYSAALLASLLSALILRVTPTPAAAVRVAATVCVGVPIVVAACTFWAVQEPRAKLNLAQFKESAAGLLSAFRTPTLLIVMAFLALLVANPGLNTPMNYHLTKTLGIAPSVVSLTESLNSVGAILASTLFLLLLANKVSVRKCLTIGILANASTMVSYFFVRGPITLGVASFLTGWGYQTGNLALLTLAALVCPKRAEAFVFAAMMAVLNLSMNYSDLAGASMYEKVFHHDIRPLLAISIGLSLLGLPIVPWLPLPKGEKKQSDVSPSESLA